MQHPSETKQHLPHLFLGEVVKINSAGKAQVRTCIITSEFLYTCRPGQHTHFRRRISLEGISKLLLVPSTSDVLVIVPEEYDLRICVNENLDEFISVLKLAFKEQRQYVDKKCPAVINDSPSKHAYVEADSTSLGGIIV